MHPEDPLIETRETAVWVVRAIALCAMLMLGGCNDGGSTTPTAYALGGTVSGLNGAGLMLANKGQTLNVGASAHSFSFGTVLASGASYAVTVQTQPTGEMCTVANGSGMAQGAAVGNVVVTCSTLAESIGGTIGGLNGSGLILANGSDALDVPANATSFILPTKVAYGSSYAVTVETQPTGIACAVSHGAGTMPASAVTNVSVSCTDQPFSLGGSIAGLTTGGLVLANGGATLSVAANATSFALPARVAFGASYAVTVQTPPTGLACTVSNGSGTMPAVNVTNVSVVCADRSYLLGGSVSGLAASGLVLANGTDTLAVAAGQTGFTMPASVAYGASYAVTVATQPTGLVCTASNGSGTMPAGNVVSVAITCATATYTVGGSISGLTASGLVLANGTDTLTVAANAANFTMPTGVASGSAYAVTVQTQPAGQLCIVASGSGTVGNSDVSSIQLTCAPNVVSFTTPESTTWTVPDGVTSVQIVVTGGGGGAGGRYFGSVAGQSGGGGAVVTTTLNVTAGEMLSLVIGGGGSAGTSGGGDGSSGSAGGGGGGGGASSVNVGTANQIIAGAGGGGGTYYQGSAGGSAGNSDGSGSAGGADLGGTPAQGGAGGSGGAGANGFFLGMAASGGSGNGGPGGNGGGSGGAGGSGSGTGSGGDGDSYTAGGGGGGYGGGGGGDIESGGGGGGSAGPNGTTFAPAGNGGTSSSSASTDGGDGSIVITMIP
jgi:hypothetical protein